MNCILSIPIDVRLVAIFLLGTCLGSLANLGIYRLAWRPRPISPWSRPDPAAPPRRGFDRLPVLGWLGLRREAVLHGPGFWIRPMLLELLCGMGLAALYYWEISGGLLPAGVRGPFQPEVLNVLHLEFAAHSVLITFMLIGSMIDADEMIIPDEITVSGALIGLLVAAVWPRSLLPDIGAGPAPQAAMILGFLHVTSPGAWPAVLGGAPQTPSLWIALGCWCLWCLAILPRTWYTRHGLRRAVQLSLARVLRQRSSVRILRMAIVGGLVIAVVWYGGGLPWQGLLSALVGMAAGGGLIWLVRIIGSAALGREAMGFGDVTLMAMIGSFLGWQSSLLIFFLAPIAGLVVGLFRAILWRNREIPYGPFLCLAALLLIICWDGFWQWSQPIFELGWLVPAAMGACLLLMGGMLAVWRLILAAIHTG